ncbi:NADPH-dependent FMN reductase [Azospirillum picis]|uniref:Chromate reductase n=1 Tax=Azospirillum picis TaxID=488438 RepID=A0ABU0MKQ3_9PROT|nr:NAD(P)H-dependent oxidoreductase [Azospirillum picis]MBP2299943.1 chromate reductase [Azospirillum picis]MDQ0533819.1 chromate reductase [Azospirillum picis]
MTDATPRAKLLGLPGSLRRNSNSLAVLQGLRDALPAGIGMEIRDLRLPLYDQDLDTPDGPAEVQALRQAIADADGVVIVTPEYNYGMPGVLKNALDWASRPYGKSALIGKPVLVISNSPAFTGGVRAHQQVNDTLLAVSAKLVGGAQVVIGMVGEKVKEGKLADEAVLKFALGAVDKLVAAGGK